MDEIEIKKIIEKIKDTEQISTGNVKKCYKIHGYAVLVCSFSQSYFENETRTKEISDFIRSKGVKTPEIYAVINDGQNVYIIQDYIEGNPVYFRNYKSYCLQNKIMQPINYEALVNQLKEEFNSLNNFDFSDILFFSREQKRKYNEGFSDYYKKRVVNDFELKNEIDYYNEIQNKVDLANIECLRKLAEMPQKFYDEFFKSLFVLYNSGVRSLDKRSDNFILDKNNRIWFIDLPNIIREEEIVPINQDRQRAFSDMLAIFTTKILSNEKLKNNCKCRKYLSEVVSKCAKTAEKNEVCDCKSIISKSIPNEFMGEDQLEQ